MAGCGYGTRPPTGSGRDMVARRCFTGEGFVHLLPRVPQIALRRMGVQRRASPTDKKSHAGTWWTLDVELGVRAASAFATPDCADNSGTSGRKMRPVRTTSLHVFFSIRIRREDARRWSATETTFSYCKGVQTASVLGFSPRRKIHICCVTPSRHNAREQMELYCATHSCRWWWSSAGLGRAPSSHASGNRPVAGAACPG